MFSTPYVQLIVTFAVINIFRGQQPEDYFTNRELRLLRSLKDYTCSFSSNAVDGSKYDPWFCVVPEECDDQTHRVPNQGTPVDCNQRPDFNYPEVRYTCCFMGNVRKKGQVAFTTPEKYWGLSGADSSFFTEYPQFLYNVQTDRFKDTMRNQNVCAILPLMYDTRNDTLYTPYVCKSSHCYLNVLPGASNKFRDREIKIEDNPGRQFCQKDYRESRSCCHPAVDIARETDDFTLEEWAVRAIDVNQTYGQGFRSSIQCEMYSKLVCDGKKDRCSQRILDRDLPVPGEHPYHALIGYQDAFTRFFHCSGSLVSRYFILSSVLCKYFDGQPSSVAMLGEYTTWEKHEFGSREVITYLAEVFTEPTFADVENANQYRHARVVLFRLWRPVQMHYWLRPACFNWRQDYRGAWEKAPIFPKWTTMIGYGTKDTKARWSRRIKRTTFFADSCQDNTTDPSSASACSACEKAFYSNDTGSPRKPMNWRDVFCQLWKNPEEKRPASENFTEIQNPCSFDLGTSASVFHTEFAPYCQWRIFGVNLIPREVCFEEYPALYRVIGGYLVPWIEQVVWSDDFQLYDVDNSWPKCHTFPEYMFDRNMIHLDLAEFYYYRNPWDY